MKIGIIGGSIAGCATAIVLARSGHDIRVFERSASELKGRGAGIATSPKVLQSLKDEDILDIQEHFLLTQLETVSNAGHWVHAENPSEFLEKLLHFL